MGIEDVERELEAEERALRRPAPPAVDVPTTRLGRVNMSHGARDDSMRLDQELPGAFDGPGGVARRFGLGASIGDAIDPSTPWGALGFATAEMLAARLVETRREAEELTGQVSLLSRTALRGAAVRAADAVAQAIQDAAPAAVRAGTLARSDTRDEVLIDFLDAEANRLQLVVRCVGLRTVAALPPLAEGE